MWSSRLNALLEGLAVIAAVLVIGHFIPANVFNADPATGGDTGSHFWPVKVLYDYGIPHGVLRPWNPGNNGGEGLLVHYFPFPFILMALGGYVLPLGQAFNLGTILPVVSLPIVVWASLRIMGLSAPVTYLAPMFTSAVVLNEGHRMWGGNGLSTMAGQFAHMYALNFLMVAIAFLWREMNRQLFPWRSAALFALVAISHGYVFIGVPALALLVALLNPTRGLTYRLSLVSMSGVLGFALAAWFVIPMVANSAWTTPHPMVWVFRDVISEVFPQMFDLIVAIGIVSAFITFYPGYRNGGVLPLRICALWGGAGCVYIAVFFLFRWLHLVDVRAVPQTQLFWAVALGILAGGAFTKVPQKFGSLILVVVLALLFVWESRHVSSFSGYMRHNYSGWSVKSGYPALVDVMKYVQGDLSQPRVAFEHNAEKNNVGTTRVFEMLPYFARRATTESLYLQSTILAPMLFSFTSEISERSSCPFRQWPCMKHRLKESEPHMELLGVQQLILSSDVSLRSADASDFLERRFSGDRWKVYQARKRVQMVDTFKKRPAWIPLVGWREAFWNWYRSYTNDSEFLVAAESTEGLPPPQSIVPERRCNPETHVDFSGIYLSTDCPGVAHYLKYAFNPSFRSSGGEQLFLVSPGYIGIVPREGAVKISYGASPLWMWSSIASVVALVFLVIAAVAERRGVFQRYAIAHQMQEPESPPPSRPHRVLWYLSLAAVTVGYLVVSVQSRSFLFWEWRKIRFDSIEVVSSNQGWGVLKKNQRHDGAPIALNGIIYREGLSTHANSEIRIKLDRKKRYFSGTCGYPDDKSQGSITCEVRTATKVLFTSPPLDSSNRAAPFNVDTGGAQELRLVVRTLKDNINYAHAVWVDLRASDL